jgi:hypothetical protein
MEVEPVHSIRCVSALGLKTLAVDEAAHKPRERAVDKLVSLYPRKCG